MYASICLSDNNLNFGFNGELMSHCIEGMCSHILTIINTNISTHFVHYINRYVNVVWTKPEVLRINALQVPQDTKKVMRRDLYQQMKQIKHSIINNNMDLCPVQYRQDVLAVLDEFLPTIKPDHVDENEVLDYSYR